MANFSKKDDDNTKSPIVKAIVSSKGTNIKPAAYDKSRKFEVETSQVVHTEVKATTAPTRVVEFVQPQVGDAETFYLREGPELVVASNSIETPTVTKEVMVSDRKLDRSGSTPEVSKVTQPYIESDTRKVTFVPDVYEPEIPKSIEFNRTTIYDTDPKSATYEKDEYTAPESAKVRFIDNDKDIESGKVTRLVAPEYEHTPESTIISKPSIVIDEFLHPTESIEADLTSSDGTNRLRKAELKAEVGDLSLKAELANFHEYMYEWRGMPTVYDIADTLGSKLGLGKISDDWEGFTYGANLVKSIHDSSGASWLESALAAFGQTTAKMVKSDAVVPLANKILDCIPVVSMFTKKKYSLSENKSTYAHEKDYETKRSWLNKLIGLASAGVCGVYYNAAFYANHNVPKEQQQYIMQKLAGNPDASAPAPAILDEERSMYAKARINGGDLFVMNKNTQTEYVGIDEQKGVGKKLNSFKNVFTQKKYKFDERTKRINPDEYEVVGPDKILTLDSQKSTMTQWGTRAVAANGPFDPAHDKGFGVAGWMFNISTGYTPLKRISGTRGDSISKYWTNAVAVSALSRDRASGTTTVVGPSYYNPPINYAEEELMATKPIRTLSEYQDYLDKLALSTRYEALYQADKDDIRYGSLPYHWSQVFRGFEISSTGNWNIALCEFDDDASLFVPKNRPTYGPWAYMPVISYEYVDKELQTTSVEVAQSLSLMIPSANTYVSTLQITFLDDRFDRIYNWFAAYVNNIYGVYDGYAKPYKNCCIKIIIDVLDWDRTILKRLKLAAIPINFSQQYSGDSSDNYKTVAVTFSVVGEVYSEKSERPANRYRPIESELLELEKLIVKHSDNRVL